MVLYKQLLTDIAAAIVDDPESVSVTEEVAVNGVITLSLTVAPSDMGKVIGKNGKIAMAIRSIIKVAAIKEHKRVIVEII